MKKSVLSIFLACGAVVGILSVSTIGCKNDVSNTPADMGANADMTPCSAFTPAPECTGATIEPLKGSRQLVISSLQIAQFNEGFDLNCDGKVDNILSPLGAVANSSIQDNFTSSRSVVVPIEMFGYTGADSSCAKFALYLGRVNEDRDGDGAETSLEPDKADCDDTDATRNPHAKEDLTNHVDDDCDGYADNATRGSAPTDTSDADGDGVTAKDGDCDERTDAAHAAIAKATHKGAKDVCNDGIDQDCNGIADDDVTCDPFTDNNQPMHVQALSFEPVPTVPDGGITSGTGLKPMISFPDGTVKNGVLTAGPDLFVLNLNVSDFELKLTLKGARVKLNLKEKNGLTYVDQGILGGVLDEVSLAQIHIDAGSILSKEQSLLDAIFVGPVATILGLQSDKDGHYLPDVDADGDGLETFWQENTTPAADGGAKKAIIDTCKDGDGTIYKNGGKGPDGQTLTYCPLAKKSNGDYLFVDGLSAALKFKAVPAQLKDITAK